MGLAWFFVTFLFGMFVDLGRCLCQNPSYFIYFLKCSLVYDVIRQDSYRKLIYKMSKDLA